MSESITRRTFCVVVGTGVASAALPACGGGIAPIGTNDAGAADMVGQQAGDMAMCPTGNGFVPAGSASSLQAGQAMHFPADNVYLLRDAQGLYAITDVCTHEGCAVQFEANKTFFCPCHFSRFDQNGGVLNGPAVTPLNHFAVCVDGSGNVVIDTNNMVDPATRS